MDNLLLQLAEDLRALRQRVANLERQERRPSVVLARAASNAGQSIANNSVTIVDYEDVTADQHGLITTGASWVFTCPTAGIYLVTAGVLFASTATWALGEVAALLLYRSGSHMSYLDRCDTLGGATQFMHLHGSDAVDCAAGDTLQIRVLQISDASLALLTTSQYNYVSVARL